MYCNDTDINRSVLRQGDIVSKIHILGAINLKQINYTHTEDNPDEKLSWMVPNPPRISDAMVLSHSCEIALENKVKVTSIILAPVRNINTATDPDRVESLIKSNLIDQSSPEASFLKYFYISKHPTLEYRDGAVVDFSKCFSIRNKSYEFLLDRKITQLTPSAAKSMALKLALYYYRNGLQSVA